MLRKKWKNSMKILNSKINFAKSRIVCLQLLTICSIILLLRETQEGEWIYILKIKLRNYTKDIIRVVRIVAVAFILILAIVLLKYKPSYQVTISGEEVGYITSKKEFEQLVNSEILNPNDTSVAYVDMEVMPEYQFLLIDNSQETSEEEIFHKIQEMAVTTYKMYAITLNNENTTYVNTREEAEETINKIKEEKESQLEEIEIGMQEVYTQDRENIQNTVEVASAINEAEIKLVEIVEEQTKRKAATLDGIYFAVKPVSGTITSRFGANESIRDHTHLGMDIAAPAGTPIKAAADGEITYAGWMGGYGNLVIISHGNGIQTYYGHCSKLYVSKGETVNAGDTIAAVGTTGNSTGNHLHFEIRKNGSQINPQKYLYK